MDREQLISQISEMMESAQAGQLDDIIEKARLDLEAKGTSKETIDKIVTAFENDVIPLAKRLVRDGLGEYTDAELQIMYDFYRANPWYLTKQAAKSENGGKIVRKTSEVTLRILMKDEDMSDDEIEEALVEMGLVDAPVRKDED